jgi:hypothetical protein
MRGIGSTDRRSVSILYGDGAPNTNLADTLDGGSASCWRLLSVGVWLWVKCFVCPDIANHAGTLVCEPCKCQSLAHIQNFRPMDFVSKKGILCGFSWCAVSRSQRLVPTDDCSGIL